MAPTPIVITIEAMGKGAFWVSFLRLRLAFCRVLSISKKSQNSTDVPFYDNAVYESTKTLNCSQLGDVLSV